MKRTSRVYSVLGAAALALGVTSLTLPAQASEPGINRIFSVGVLDEAQYDYDDAVMETLFGQDGSREKAEFAALDGAGGTEPVFPWVLIPQD